jgi:hypothetical protein
MSDRTQNRQSDLAVIGGRGQNQRRSATCLFVAGLGIHGNSDHIASVGDASHRLPSLSPLSRARVDLLVEVALAHATQELVEARRGRAGWLQN